VEKTHKNLKVYTHVKGQDAKSRAEAKGAWRSFDSGYKPQPGDTYVLHYVDPPTKWSHMGFIKSTEDLGGGLERWITVDGGQRIQPGAPDRITMRERTYDRAKRLVLGGENADSDPRLLPGWLNPDVLVTPKK
jgi:hypothetical protein